MAAIVHPARPAYARFPVVALLDPRERARFVAVMLAFGLLLGWSTMAWFGWPVWAATATALAVLVVPGVAKWRDDARRYGRTAMVLSVLLVTQGIHGFEHVVQWFQFHVLNFTLRSSNGLLSPANAEWIHFAWNWSVLLVIAYLVWQGMRGPWAWLLVGWALAHSLEHTYLLVRYLDVLAQLERMGVTTVTAQALPGVLGQDGWLARSAATQGTFLCRLPGLTTATRLDVHFWWNVGEIALLLPAAHQFLLRHPAWRDRRQFQDEATPL